jgi:hypothetical protein
LFRDLNYCLRDVFTLCHLLGDLCDRLLDVIIIVAFFISNRLLLGKLEY